MLFTFYYSLKILFLSTEDILYYVLVVLTLDFSTMGLSLILQINPRGKIYVNFFAKSFSVSSVFPAEGSRSKINLK